jgi:hypothetical protein
MRATISARNVRRHSTGYAVTQQQQRAHSRCSCEKHRLRGVTLRGLVVQPASTSHVCAHRLVTRIRGWTQLFTPVAALVAGAGKSHPCGASTVEPDVAGARFSLPELCTHTTAHKRPCCSCTVLLSGARGAGIPCGLSRSRRCGATRGQPVPASGLPRTAGGGHPVQRGHLVVSPERARNIPRMPRRRDTTAPLGAKSHSVARQTKSCCRVR